MDEETLFVIHYCTHLETWRWKTVLVSQSSHKMKPCMHRPVNSMHTPSYITQPHQYLPEWQPNAQRGMMNALQSTQHEEFSLESMNILFYYKHGIQPQLLLELNAWFYGAKPHIIANPSSSNNTCTLCLSQHFCSMLTYHFFSWQAGPCWRIWVLFLPLTGRVFYNGIMNKNTCAFHRVSEHCPKGYWLTSFITDMSQASSLRSLWSPPWDWLIQH